MEAAGKTFAGRTPPTTCAECAVIEERGYQEQAKRNDEARQNLIDAANFL